MSSTVKTIIFIGGVLIASFLLYIKSDNNYYNQLDDDLEVLIYQKTIFGTYDNFLDKIKHTIEESNETALSEYNKTRIEFAKIIYLHYSHADNIKGTYRNGNLEHALISYLTFNYKEGSSSAIDYLDKRCPTIKSYAMDTRRCERHESRCNGYSNKELCILKYCFALEIDGSDRVRGDDDLSRMYAELINNKKTCFYVGE